MMKMELRTALILLLGSLAVIGALLFHSEAGAADAPKVILPGQTTTPINPPPDGSRPAAGQSQSQGMPLPGRQAAQGSTTQGPQVAPPADAAIAPGQPPVIEVTKDDRISADIKGRPLGETLRAMAGKKLFDIRGPLPAGEEITAQFTGLTLDQALKKLMRGYNYVLLDEGTSQKPVLLLIGKIQRSTSGEQPSAVQRVQPGGNQPPEPARSYVPPTPGEPQPPPAARRGPPTAPQGAEGAAAPAQGGVQPTEAAPGAPGQVQTPGQQAQPGQGQTPGQPGQTQPPAQAQPAQGQPPQPEQPQPSPQEGTSGPLPSGF